MRIGIVTPVFNDWDALRELVQEIDQVSIGSGNEIDILAVNDGSNSPHNLTLQLLPKTAIGSIECLHLMRNVGHQRAIAVGLVEAEMRPDLDAVIIMDSDGEDKPEDILVLLEAHRSNPQSVIVAARGTRSGERWFFRWFYVLYKLLFRLLVGKRINFGNFCLIPRDLLSNLTYDPNTWNHVAAAVSQSKLPIVQIKIDRGRRYNGSSKMHFDTLVMHGLSAMSVYIDLLFVRILIMSISVALGAFLGILIVVGILLFTDLAIPGWATNAVGILLIIIFQTVIFSSSAVFFVLSMRSRPLIVPAVDTGRFIKRREMLYERSRRIVHIPG